MADNFVIKLFLLANKKVFAQQRNEGALEILIGLVKDGLLSLSEAAKRMNMTVEEFERQTGLKTQ